VLLENLADSRRRDMVPQIRKRTDDPVLFPQRILAGHAQRELDDSLHDSSSAPPTAREGPLLSDQVPMPAQDRLWGDNARELIQHATAKCHAANCQADPVGVGEAEPAPSKLALQDANLFLNVLEHVLLMAIESAGKDDGEDLEDAWHGARQGSYAGGTGSFWFGRVVQPSAASGRAPQRWAAMRQRSRHG
jgi:hypothetical protein